MVLDIIGIVVGSPRVVAEYIMASGARVDEGNPVGRGLVNWRLAAIMMIDAFTPPGNIARLPAAIETIVDVL